LLEDDNWWEPEFLASALAALEQHADASLVWANMKLWNEEPDGRWTDTGRTIWQLAPTSPSVIEFREPELLQAFDALHSNGAMLFRPSHFHARAVPSVTPFAIIEQMRERAATGPLLLLTAPLANFACTLGTARDRDPVRWLQAKLLIAASFFQVQAVSDDALKKMWTTRRAQRPRDTGIFFCLALALRRPRLVRHAQFGDWLHFILSAVRHPGRLLRGLGFRRDHADVWRWLCTTTATNPAPVRATVTAKQL
jgi:hypothetical protein